MCSTGLGEYLPLLYEHEHIDEKDIEKIIDLLNILSKYGCDDEYTVDEVVDKALELAVSDEDRSFTIDCRGIRIIVEKKSNVFSIREETDVFTL